MSFMDHFMERYYPLLGIRKDSFKFVFENAERQEGKPCVVETGTCRSGDWKGDGCSSVMFGQYCKTREGRLYTVDNSFDAMRACYSMTPQLRGSMEYVVSDSLKFLRWFSRQIDILYLDSYDWGPGREQDSQRHSLSEIQLSMHNLTPESIVVIDDTKLKDGGKGGLSVPWLTGQGWKVVYEDYQTVLMRGI